MPELPEVETTRRGISPHLVGQHVCALDLHTPRLRLPFTPGMAAAVVNKRITDVRRRGKYLLLDFAHGSLIVHLGMSGSLRLAKAGEALRKHEHFELSLENGGILRLRDPRRFGLVLWHDGDALQHRLLASLGLEPLAADFNAERLYQLTRGLRAPIKNVLMDARRIVGVGNIYAAESLFHAGIHPLTPAGKLSRPRSTRLVTAVRQTLSDAIAAGGSSLRDFVSASGQAGYFQQTFFVYGRGGQPCRRCEATIVQQKIAQRSTCWCPRCQRK